MTERQTERRQLAGNERDSVRMTLRMRSIYAAIATFAGKLPAVRRAPKFMSNSLQLLQNWIDAFQKRDLERVIDCYADNATNFQIAAGEPATGKAQIRIDTAEFFKGFPDAWSIVENLISDGDWAAWEWIGDGTFLGEFYGNKPTGKLFEFRGCGFFQFENDKIVLQRGYWDKLSWYSRIGLEIEKI